MARSMHMDDDAGGGARREAAAATLPPRDAGDAGAPALPAREMEAKPGARAASSLRVVAVVPSHGRATELSHVLADLAVSRREVLLDDASIRRVQLSAIVVDTASEPALRASVDGLDLRTIRLRENVGGAGGFSAGIAAALREGAHDEHGARGPDYVWLVDSDARIHVDALAHLVRALEADPRAVAAGAAIEEPGTGRVHECGGRISRVTGVMRPARAGRARGSGAEPGAIEVDYVAACCALVRTNAIHRAGLWRDLFLSHDDAEWFVRLSRASGGRVLAVPDARAAHPVFGRGITWQRYYSARNAMQPARVLGASWWAPVRRGLRAMTEVARAARCAMRGEHGLAMLHLEGLRDGLRGDFSRRGRIGWSASGAHTSAGRGARSWIGAAGCVLRGTPLAIGHALRRSSTPRVWTAHELRTLEVQGTASRSTDRPLSAADLSIVVLSYRRPDALARTLAALRDDPDLRGAEIIVVDNASRDGTIDRVRREHPGARILETEANVGVDAFNRGVACSVREVVLVLDDDAAPDAGAVRRSLEMLDRDRSLAAVTLHPKHPRSGQREWRFADRAGGAWARDWPVMGCANLVRRSCWDAVGGYERGFFLYRNDADLALKLLACGWAVGFHPELIVWHDSPFAARKSVRWCRLATRNWIWLCRRHGGRGSGVLSGVLGWAWAHRLAGRSASRHGAVLRGVFEGVLTRGPALHATCAPTGRDLAHLLRLQIAGAGSTNKSSSDRHSA